MINEDYLTPTSIEKDYVDARKYLLQMAQYAGERSYKASGLHRRGPEDTAVSVSEHRLMYDEPQTGLSRGQGKTGCKKSKAPKYFDRGRPMKYPFKLSGTPLNED